MSDKDFKLEPFEPNKNKSLGVFQIGDDYWFVGYDVESCIDECLKNYCEGFDIGNTFMLSDDDLHKYKYFDDDTGEASTFLEQLEKEKLEGGDFPRLFATEEY